MIYVIQKIHHFTLISRGCAWLSMKRGGCKFGGSKTGAVLCAKRGAVVSQLVLKLKESVPPSSGVPLTIKSKDKSFVVHQQGTNFKASPATESLRVAAGCYSFGIGHE